MISKILKNKFLTGSLIMVIGSNFSNLSQLVFHFLSGRFLGKAQYGDLAALISILGIINILQLALTLTIIKFIASEKDEEAVSNFIKWINRFNVYISGLCALILLAVSPLISSFLNLSEPNSVYMLAPILFFTMWATTSRAILQGLLKFNLYIVTMVVDSSAKIILVAILIFLGYSIFGAMSAMLLGVILGTIVSRLYLSKYLKGSFGLRPKIKPLLKYSIFALIQGLALTSMYSVDLLLVKHFFSSDEAGIYASLAVLGRIVFFGTTPITNVMFPMIAKKYHAGEDYYKIFYLSLFLVVLISFGVLGLFYLVPEFAIGILYGKSFLSGASLLWWFAVFMMLLSIAMLLTQFYLSIGKTKIITLFVVTAILQVILIWFIHGTILNVIQDSIFSVSLLDLCLFTYFPYQKLKDTKMNSAIIKE
jgi:O-antigen/teichoic acid export membrane protein